MQRAAHKLIIVLNYSYMIYFINNWIKQCVIVWINAQKCSMSEFYWSKIKCAHSVTEKADRREGCEGKNNF